VEGIQKQRQLALKAGFLSDTETSISKPVGKLKKEQKICEAVVAIPFYLNSRNNRKYLRIRSSIINKAKDLNLNLSKLREDTSYEEYFNNPGQTPVETVAYQLRMMEKYVFPPEFDFLKFPTGGHRQSMFVFQFNAALNQEDLRNVWQNVMPSSQESGARTRFSVNAEDAEKFTSPFSASDSDDGTQRDTKIISVFLDSENNNELLSYSRNRYFNNDIKWIVFKVKKRAKVSVLEEKQASLPASKAMELASSYVTRNPDFDDYTRTIKKASYNWPYDYFSLIELVKVKAKADFATKNTTGAIVEGD
jgi:hypothetical protein